jgi:hypothetical protein
LILAKLTADSVTKPRPVGGARTPLLRMTQIVIDGMCIKANLDSGNRSLLRQLAMHAIFEQKEHTRTAPKTQGEDDYSFYDSSARPEFETYRALLNGWMAELPEADRVEMITRFRMGTDLQYQANWASVENRVRIDE